MIESTVRLSRYWLTWKFDCTCLFDYLIKINRKPINWPKLEIFNSRNESIWCSACFHRCFPISGFARRFSIYSTPPPQTLLLRIYLLFAFNHLFLCSSSSSLSLSPCLALCMPSINIRQILYTLPVRACSTSFIVLLDILRVIRAKLRPKLDTSKTWVDL